MCVSGELEAAGSAELPGAKRITAGTITLVLGHCDGWLTSKYEMGSKQILDKLSNRKTIAEGAVNSTRPFNPSASACMTFLHKRGPLKH